MNTSRRDTRTACEYEFDWVGSGDQTFKHNYDLPLRHGKYAGGIQVLVGDAYIASIAADSFVITATSAAGRGLFKADVKVNDYGEAV